VHRPEINTVKVLCIRRKVDGGIAPNSHVLQLSLDRGSAEKPQWVGWERNEREKLGPRLADLAATMDPVRCVNYFYSQILTVLICLVLTITI
jgi:ubiquitin-like modifier-activating enzyme ATG7